MNIHTWTFESGDTKATVLVNRQVEGCPCHVDIQTAPHGLDMKPDDIAALGAMLTAIGKHYQDESEE